MSITTTMNIVPRKKHITRLIYEAQPSPIRSPEFSRDRLRKYFKPTMLFLLQALFLSLFFNSHPQSRRRLGLFGRKKLENQPFDLVLKKETTALRAAGLVAQFVGLVAEAIFTENVRDVGLGNREIAPITIYYEGSTKKKIAGFTVPWLGTGKRAKFTHIKFRKPKKKKYSYTRVIFDAPLTNNWLSRNLGLGVVDRKMYLSERLDGERVAAAVKFFHELDRCEYTYTKPKRFGWFRRTTNVAYIGEGKGEGSWIQIMGLREEFAQLKRALAHSCPECKGHGALCPEPEMCGQQPQEHNDPCNTCDGSGKVTTGCDCRACTAYESAKAHFRQDWLRYPEDTHFKKVLCPEDI